MVVAGTADVRVQQRQLAVVGASGRALPIQTMLQDPLNAAV